MTDNPEAMTAYKRYLKTHFAPEFYCLLYGSEFIPEDNEDTTSHAFDGFGDLLAEINAVEGSLTIPNPLMLADSKPTMPLVDAEKGKKYTEESKQ